MALLIVALITASKRIINDSINAFEIPVDQVDRMTSYFQLATTVDPRSPPTELRDQARPPLVV